MYSRLNRRKGQSMLEYAILLAVVISALLLMAAIVKRGFSGNLNEAADRMGEQYSPTSTTMKTENKMLDNDQEIIEETNTTKTTIDKDGNIINVGIDQFIPADFGYTPLYVGDRGIYSFTSRLNQEFSSETNTRTDSASKELYRWSEFEKQATTWPDFPEPFSLP